MQTFVNERSAHEQCADRTTVNHVVKTFVDILSTIREYRRADRGWLGPRISLYEKGDIRSWCVLLSGAAVGTLLLAVSDSLIRTQLKIAITQLRIEDWQLAPMQKDNMLYYLRSGELLNSDSMAELAERALQTFDMPGLLINFGRSIFASLTYVDVMREDEGGGCEEVRLPMVESAEALESWAAELGYLPRPYPTDSIFPPNDDQTILIDASRFERTNFREQGRVVYRESVTGCYWYVDNLHFGRSAEIEVFDSKGFHYGTSDLTGTIDTNKQVNGRSIDL